MKELMSYVKTDANPESVGIPLAVKEHGGD